MSHSKELKDSYLNWLKNELIFTDLDANYVSISTPFIDSNYDNIELFAKFVSNDEIELSDFGYTLFNLEDAGLSISKRSKTIYKIYKNILSDFGISEEGKTLKITTSLKLFPTAKNRLLQAIMHINDLLYLNKQNVKSSFNEIISDFLIKNDVLFSPNIEIAGKHGISSHFDFSIPLPAGKEKLIKTVTRPNDINQAKIFNFDVRETHTLRNANYILMLNDNEKAIKSSMKESALLDLNSNIASVLGFTEVEKEPKLIS